MKRTVEAIGAEVPSDGSNNPVLAVINQRKSVRELFTSRAIPDNVVHNIVESGLRAPSSKNAKPWQLHVVKSRQILVGIAQAMDSDSGVETFVPKDPSSGAPKSAYRSTVLESAEVLRQVPLAIFLENRGKFSESRLTVANSPDESIDEALIGMGLEYIGLGACIENMWLAAEAQGVRGAFMGDVIISEPYIKDRLTMVGDLVGVLALGYSDVELQARPVDREFAVWHDR